MADCGPSPKQYESGPGSGYAALVGPFRSAHRRGPGAPMAKNAQRKLLGSLLLGGPPGALGAFAVRDPFLLAVKMSALVLDSSTGALSSPLLGPPFPFPLGPPRIVDASRIPASPS